MDELMLKLTVGFVIAGAIYLLVQLIKWSAMNFGCWVIVFGIIVLGLVCRS